MNHSIRRAALLAAVGLPAILGAQAASAALITTWDFEVDSAFTAFTQDDGDGPDVNGTGGNAVLGGDTTLSWGISTGGGQSSVSITPDVDGSGLMTNGDSEDGATFTHDNNILEAGGTQLDTFDVTTQLTLTGTAEEDPPGGSLTGDDEIVGPITFNSFFTETFNAEPCVGDSESVCDDIFVLSNADALGALGSGQSFIVDDYRYTVFLGLEDLETLTEMECNAAGADAGCAGLTTPEDTATTFNTTLRIEAQEVPAPGILALFGIGLMGLGFAAKRRSDKA